MPAISFSGIASGLDTQSIIKSLLDARKIGLRPLESKIDQNDKETAAYDEIKSKLKKFQDAVKDFQTASGAAIQKKATSSNTEIVGVTASTGAQASSTTITSVTSLAKAATLSFADRFTADDQPIAAGLAAPVDITVTVGIGGAARTATVSVSSTTTLSQIVAGINDQMSGYAVASVVNTGTIAAPQYGLLINGQKTGVQDGSLSVIVPPELQAQGFFAAPPSLDQATDAVFNVQGLGEIRRATNSVSGLIPGLTFDIKKISEEDVLVNVTTDKERTSQKIQAFIDAFNDLVTYSRANSEVKRVVVGENAGNIFGTLARSTVDERAIAEIKGVISSTFSGVDGSYVQTAADIGISIEAKGSTSASGETTAFGGTYKFNRAERGTDANKKWSFEEAMERDPAAVEKLLNRIADNLTSEASNGVTLVYTRLNGLIDNSKSANEEENKTHQDRIERLNRSIAAQEATLKKVFTNLETTIGRLNSGSAALTSVLQGLQTRR